MPGSLRLPKIQEAHGGTHVLVVVIGTVLVDVTSSVDAGCVWTDVTVRVVPGAVLHTGKPWSAIDGRRFADILQSLRGLNNGGARCSRHFRGGVCRRGRSGLCEGIVSAGSFGERKRASAYRHGGGDVSRDSLVGTVSLG